jgi:hypothetical protein
MNLVRRLTAGSLGAAFWVASNASFAQQQPEPPTGTPPSVAPDTPPAPPPGPPPATRGYGPRPYPGYAQPYPPPGYYPPPPPPYWAPRRRYIFYELPPPHIHDGFFLHLSVGLGYFHDSASELGSSFTVSGAALTGDIMLGGSPVPGLAIGGGVIWAAVPNPTYTAAGQSVTGNSAMSLTTIGPFVEWYPDPRGGFHFGALLGFAEQDLEDYRGFGTVGRTGVAVAANIGQDWWVGRRLSLGVEARIEYASVKSGGASDSTVLPAILFTVTSY